MTKTVEVMIFSPAGELLAPVAAEAMEEGTVSDDAGATAGDSDDSLQQSSVQLLETIDEPLTHDMTGTSFAFSTKHILSSFLKNGNLNFKTKNINEV